VPTNHERTSHAIHAPSAFIDPNAQPINHTKLTGQEVDRALTPDDACDRLDAHVNRIEMDNTFSELLPHPALRPFVDRLWTRNVPEGAVPVRILPDGCMDLLVNTTHPDNSIVVGTMTRATVFEPGRAVRLVAVRFWPGCAASFLGVTAEELTDGTEGLADIGLRWLAPAQIADRSDPREAVRSLERALLERLRVIGAPDRTVAYAVAALSGPAAPSIASLARTIGWTRQHLGRSFRHHVGVGPKQFARVARLQRAVIQLQRAEHRSLADAAIAFGYFDQAHLIHDFREFTGQTPTVWRQQQVAFLQDSEPHVPLT